MLSLPACPDTAAETGEREDASSQQKTEHNVKNRRGFLFFPLPFLPLLQPYMSATAIRKRVTQGKALADWESTF